MKNIKMKMMVALLMILFSANLFGQTSSGISNQSFLIQFKASMTKTEIENFLKTKNLKIKKVLKNNLVSVILNDVTFNKVANGEEASIIQEKISIVNQSQNVLSAQPNYKYYLTTTPNDPGIAGAYALNNTGQNNGTYDADMDVFEAWDLITGNSTVKVGVIDSGIDFNHPDLSPNIWVNTGEIPNNYIDDDNNGYIDDVRGWNFLENDNNTLDAMGHGTHVAGIIGAKGNNGIGISGVVWDCKIVPLKVFDSYGNGGYSDDIIDAIQYAEDIGVRVLNCSWGGYGYDGFMYGEMLNSPILFICAAGNDTNNNDSAPFYPSSYLSMFNKIAVASTNKYDQLSYFSNYGSISVDVAAPGELILSTKPTNVVCYLDTVSRTPGYGKFGAPGYGLSSGQYATLSGTSMAAPQVTGIAVLMLAAIPQLTATDIVFRIEQNTDLLTNLTGKTFFGRVNANTALQTLRKNITITNNFTGGTVKVNNTTRNTPYSFSGWIDQQVKIEAVSPQVIGGLTYNYYQWQGSLVTTSDNPNYFNIADHETWKAHFTVGKSVVLANEDEIGNNLIGTTLKVDNLFNITSNDQTYLSLTTHNIKTNHETVSQNGTLKHNNWNVNKSEYLLSHTINVSQQSSEKDAAKFKKLNPASISLSMDGIAASASIQIKDPWYVETNGSQPGNWKTYPSGFTPSTMPNGGIFLNEEIIPGNPTYSAKVTETYIPNLNGSNAWFQYWSGPTGSIDNPAASETPIVFKNANDVILANYKGHLRTGVPDLSDAKNQRRYLINGLVSNKQVMVYESMGHVWISHSTDGGATWSAEKRLSGINGGGNPTLSNMIDWDGSNAYFAVSWVENTSVMIQSMVISGTQLYFGWTNYSSTQNAENLINVSQSKTLEYSLTTGRPALAIQTWFDGGIPKEIDVRFAHETAYGLVFAELRTGGYRRLDLANVITQPPIGGVVAHVSTNSADCQPVLISYPAASGQPAKSVLYYLGTGYAPGYRIVEFDTQTQVKRVLSTASNDYTYHSLAGAVNSTSASFALVATAQVNTPSVAYNTNIYTKPTYYGNSLPTVAKVYTNTVKPAIMVQNTSGFGSPTYQVHMTTNGTTRVKADGGSTLTTVATNTAGSWLSAQVGSGNRKAMVVSTLQQTPEGPATISYYSGSSQQMNKEGDYQVDVRAFRYFTLKTGKSGYAVLDFSGSQVEAIDSLEVGENLAVVLVKNPASSGVLVYQPDSLVVPLSVDVIRDGKEIAAYAAASWKSLGMASFADLRDGDVLRFRLADPVTATWGYEEYTVTDEAMAKEEAPEESVEELESLTEGIKIYPNPFNPVTTIQVSLAEPKMVRLAVYNILGQMVSELVNGELGAGRHSYSFNGSNLSSGTYFYRLEAGGEVTTGKLQLLK